MQQHQRRISNDLERFVAAEIADVEVDSSINISNQGSEIDFADHHAGTMFMQMGGYNPYKVGIELFRDIEERWNKGRFGRDWDECDDVRERKNWDKKTGLGRDKIFEIRKIYNDVTFIDEFLSEDFCVRNKMHVLK